VRGQTQRSREISGKLDRFNLDFYVQFDNIESKSLEGLISAGGDCKKQPTGLPLTRAERIPLRETT